MGAANPTPPPPPRLGPRPLALHLTTAVTTWLNSASVLPLLRSGLDALSPDGQKGPTLWHASLKDRGEALVRALADAPAEPLAGAVAREIRRRLDTLERGITAYRHHPYRRDLPQPPVVWAEGSTRLLDYGATAAGAANGAPLLVVPSLINRAYILDLWAERSLLRHLAGQGFRPFLVDWDRPGEAERGFDLTAYIAGRLGAALDRVAARAGRPPVVVGYCMGGLLALALAQLRPRDVAGLMLLATPWDFHAEKAALGRMVAQCTAAWLPLFDRMGEMPVDVLQALFSALDPFQVVRKFCAFAQLDPADRRAREFVALEDWLNDGVPLAAPVARECLLGWYGDNTPGRGEWRIAGRTIDPAALRLPTLVVIPEQDRIVPPAAARALARQIPGAVTLTPPLGHIGMVSSSRAPTMLWPELSRWLAACLATGKAAGL